LLPQQSSKDLACDSALLPSAEFPRAWKHYKVRPDSSAPRERRSKTNADYCRYDEAHNDYPYSQQYVDFIVTELASPDRFKSVIGWEPKAL
jgi:hypothetical protein